MKYTMRQNCPNIPHVKNAKAANARYIGPMTEAVAEELRAELARQKRSAKSFAEAEGLNRSTLHKTLNAQRAIDVDDLFHLADLLGVSPSAMFSRAEIIARAQLDDGLDDYERAGIDRDAHVGDSPEDYDLAANDSIDETNNDEHDFHA